MQPPTHTGSRQLSVSCRIWDMSFHFLGERMAWGPMFTLLSTPLPPPTVSCAYITPLGPLLQLSHIRLQKRSFNHKVMSTCNDFSGPTPTPTSQSSKNGLGFEAKALHSSFSLHLLPLLHLLLLSVLFTSLFLSMFVPFCTQAPPGPLGSAFANICLLGDSPSVNGLIYC